MESASAVSDDRLKCRIAPVDNALEKVKSLTAFTYTLTDVAYRHGITDTSVQVGLSAQDVQRVLPEAVRAAPFDVDPKTGASKSGEDYLMINYERLVPLLIEAIKQQDAKINELQTELRLAGI